MPQDYNQPHIPVMLSEVHQYLNLQRDGVYLDGGQRAGIDSCQSEIRLSSDGLLGDEDGQIIEAHSVSAGLDYPGVGPEHAFLKEVDRAEYVAIDDQEALEAFRNLNLLEGILPALESSHAIAYAMKLAATMKKDENIVVNLSGRGDKDIPTVAQIDGISID